jgi:hypothetical protein
MLDLDSKLIWNHNPEQNTSKLSAFKLCIANTPPPPFPQGEKTDLGQLFPFVHQGCTVNVTVNSQRCHGGKNQAKTNNGNVQNVHNDFSPVSTGAGVVHVAAYRGRCHRRAGRA